MPSRFFVLALSIFAFAWGESSEARTVIFVGGANMSQAQANEWGRQFRLKHPGVNVVPLRGPRCPGQEQYYCSRGDTDLVNRIRNALRASGDDEVDMIGHSSGTGPVEKVSFESENINRQIRIYNLDGFPPGLPPKGFSKREVTCVSSLTRLRNGQIFRRSGNWQAMTVPACNRKTVLEFPELATNWSTPSCLHMRLVGQNECSTDATLRQTFVLESAYWSPNGPMNVIQVPPLDPATIPNPGQVIPHPSQVIVPHPPRPQQQRPAQQTQQRPAQQQQQQPAVQAPAR